MPHKYTLEWLDLLITVTLNPSKTDVVKITEDQIRSILSKISEENDNLQSVLKNQVFSITKEKQLELLIKQYHSSLIILLDQACENQKRSFSKNHLLDEVNKSVISCLDEFLSFIEVRFSTYLSLSERVPLTYLNVTKKELRTKINKLKNSLINKVGDKHLTDIVLSNLLSFTNSSYDSHKTTFGEVLYNKELVKELEMLDKPEKETCIYSALNELLIYLNFNSKAFANHFTQRLAEKINEFQNITDKLDQLLLHYKEFNQMHRKPHAVLNPQFRDLKPVLSNWFMQEIFYLEKKLHFSVVPLNAKTENIQQAKEILEKGKQKVLCVLSSDQMGLILRASDELKILMAKSLNEVFKTIVPYLSTPYKESLSYDGMRSKSYMAEERDKQLAIETLERIIKRIKEY